MSEQSAIEPTSPPAGWYLMLAAQRLVLDVLALHPEGLTNTTIGAITGLNLPVKQHPGYVSHTILQYLVDHGRVVKDDRVYRLARGSWPEITPLPQPRRTAAASHSGPRSQEKIEPASERHRAGARPNQLTRGNRTAP